MSPNPFLQPDASAGETLLYVHGYHISFEKGCRRAALFRENAGLEGRLLWCSWPSDGALASAGNDVATLAGVEVVDVSDLPAATPTGHSYHIYSKAVGEDLDQLLNEGKPAAQRRNMRQHEGNLWPSSWLAQLNGGY